MKSGMKVVWELVIPNLKWKKKNISEFLIFQNGASWSTNKISYKQTSLEENWCKRISQSPDFDSDTVF